jgi:2,4-dienoyl-CoA reductase-like NADH-dependent reductase (Old Yellow Enzyme family)
VSTRKALRPEIWGETLARTVRDASAPGYVIANGGLSTPADCEAALENTGATLVSLARAFLANPDWMVRAFSNRPLARYAPGLEREPLLQARNEIETT